jgi:hypothetical protein
MLGFLPTELSYMLQYKAKRKGKAKTVHTSSSQNS